jgi:hypothetical protein
MMMLLLAATMLAVLTLRAIPVGAALRAVRSVPIIGIIIVVVVVTGIVRVAADQAIAATQLIGAFGCWANWVATAVADAATAFLGLDTVAVPADFAAFTAVAAGAAVPAIAVQIGAVVTLAVIAAALAVATVADARATQAVETLILGTVIQRRTTEVGRNTNAVAALLVVVVAAKFATGERVIVIATSAYGVAAPITAAVNRTAVVRVFAALVSVADKMRGAFAAKVSVIALTSAATRLAAALLVLRIGAAFSGSFAVQRVAAAPVLTANTGATAVFATSFLVGTTACATGAAGEPGIDALVIDA